MSPYKKDQTSGYGNRGTSTGFKPRPFGARGGSTRGGFGRDSERSGGFGRDSGSFGRKRKTDFEMFNVICDKCGKDTEVPFKPTSGKPVYCSDCFKKTDREDSGRSSSRDTGRSRPDNSEEFAKLHKKLDKIIASLEIDDDEE